MKSVLAWHFLAADCRMAHEGEVVEAGYVYSAVGPLELCSNGMHASIAPIDAIQYAPGPVVCRVRCSGETVHGSDKLVCRDREVLWMADASSILRLIATECVRKTPLSDGRTVWDLLTDPRSRTAIEVAERFAHEKATEKELDAARAAAWAAAWAAASDAERAAANAAAWATEMAAERAAERAAANAAAWATEMAAAWAAQNKIATDLLMTLAPKERKQS